jgi:hypothetical protein
VLDATLAGASVDQLEAGLGARRGAGVVVGMSAAERTESYSHEGAHSPKHASVHPPQHEIVHPTKREEPNQAKSDTSTLASALLLVGMVILGSIALPTAIGLAGCLGILAVVLFFLRD